MRRNVIKEYIMIAVNNNQTRINGWNIEHSFLVIRHSRCTVKTKCSPHLSHSRLHICTPGSFSGYRIPLPSSVSSSLFPLLPVLLSSFCSVFSALWGGCSRADRECHWLLSQHITLSFWYFFMLSPSLSHTNTTAAHIHMLLYPTPCSYYGLEEQKQSGDRPVMIIIDLSYNMWTLIIFAGLNIAQCAALWTTNPSNVSF